MSDIFILAVFSIQVVLIFALIYVIFQLKSHIVLLESKIYGQQISLSKMQDNLNQLNDFLHLNTSKYKYKK